MNVITILLRDMHERDQTRRREIVAKYGSKLVKSRNVIPFHVFRGETDEKVNVVTFLLDNDALKDPVAFYYAALIIINSGSLEQIKRAYSLISKYRKLGGLKSFYLGEEFFAKQHWGKSREEVLSEIDEELGEDPRILEI